MSGSATVARVLRGDLCAGCGLCASVSGGAIVMETLPPGYSRPRVVGLVPPPAERVIAAACPGAVVEPWTGAPDVDPYWGPWRSIATGHATDPDLRWRASSGGALSALAAHALSTGLVDRVLHVAADPGFPTRNAVVVSASQEEVIAGSGSRYASSSPLASIDALLGEKGVFAFIGKPCDVSAMRRLAHVDTRVAEHVPLMLSFFCAGVPSHDAADRVLAAMGAPPGQTRAFRYRGEGWPGHAKATLADGTTRELSYARSWGEHLSKEIQFRCKICPDGVGGAADVACADAWYGDEDGYPTFEEQDGRSLIMARTSVGQALVDSALAAGAIQAESLAADRIALMQPGQTRRKRLVGARVAALRLTGQPAPRMTGTLVEVAGRRAGAAERLRNLVGTIRRVLNGRRSRL
jgi:coenzyme F420 hydrogenase subunit beta